MGTKGRRRAVVAVARKLAVFASSLEPVAFTGSLRRMWIDGTECRQEQVGGQA